MPEELARNPTQDARGGLGPNGAMRVRVRVLAASPLAVVAALLASGLPQAQAAPPASEACAGAGCFQLNALSIEGSTVYGPADLAPLYSHYLTRTVTTADLVQIAAAITDRYRADGYFLSRAVVPTQSGGAGIGRIMVYEGYVGTVDVTGAGAAAVSRYLKDLPGRRPLRLADLDRRLSLAGDAPGVEVKSTLVPVVDDPSRHNLVVTAGLRRLNVTAYADNRGSKTAGPWQSYFRAALNSLARTGDQLGFAVLTIPDDVRAFTLGELTYSMPVGDGPRLRGAISLSQARDGADPLSAARGGESRTASLGYFHPLKRGRKVSIWTLLTADSRHIEQDWSDVGGYSDDVRVLRGAVNGDFGDGGRSTQIFVQLSTGERGAPSADASLSRADADRTFSKVNVHAAHYRDLGSHAGLYLAGDGQWSPDALLASEEFAAGGAPYGRGYDYAEISGDRGLAGTAELRVGWDPKRAPIRFVQGYGFFDVAQVWNVNPRNDSASLASAGVGVRVRVGERVTVGLEAAKPLTRTPYGRGDKDWRPSISVSARF